MAFEIIENRGPNLLSSTLRDLLGRSHAADFQVAFLTQAGLSELLPRLLRVARRGKVRVLTGLFNWVTEPEALNELLRAQESTRGRLAARISRNPGFHRKLYLLRTSRMSHVVVGSSNLTKEGLSSSGEFNVYFSEGFATQSSKHIGNALEDEWHRGRSLTAGLIDRYMKARGARRPPTFFSASQLRRILGPNPSPRAGQRVDAHKGKYWLDWVDGIVRKETEEVVGRETDWEARGFEWYSPAGRHPFRENDHLLMFDYEGRRPHWAHIMKVVDTTRTSIPTRDGRYFVAYRPARLGRRKIGPTLRNDLDQAGLHIKGRGRPRRRRLTEECWKSVFDVFRG